MATNPYALGQKLIPWLGVRDKRPCVA